MGRLPASIRRATICSCDASEDPKFSPDGNHIAFVRKHNLYVQQVTEGTARPLTSDTDENILNGDHHVAFVLGAVQGEQNVLVRVHSECLTGDVFRSLKCDCGLQLDAAKLDRYLAMYANRDTLDAPDDVRRAISILYARAAAKGLMRAGVAVEFAP